MQTSVTDLLYQIVIRDIQQSNALLQTDTLNRQSNKLINLPSSQILLEKIYTTINSKKNHRSNPVPQQRQHKTSFTMDEASSHNTTATKCNCKKSKCLKLYCECFSQGLFCKGCNCVCCQNKEEFSDIRAKAIDQVIGRAPLPFGQRSSSIKGCNCRKTGCQKKYCECFGNGDKCNEYCKCENCMNLQ